MVLGLVYVTYIISYPLFYQRTNRKKQERVLIPTFTGGEFSLDLNTAFRRGTSRKPPPTPNKPARAPIKNPIPIKLMH
jgi:hypothetical protein